MHDTGVFSFELIQAFEKENSAGGDLAVNVSLVSKDPRPRR